VNQIVPFADLPFADLIVDAVYEGGGAGNSGDDPISKLLRCGNQGGFRKVGSPAKLVVLYSSLEDRDWPDGLDTATGLFVYYGDNKQPGKELHGTPQRGNELLRAVYADIHASPPQRGDVPPFFIFTKHPTTRSRRSVQFRGLAAPGGTGIAPTEDLLALWKSTGGQRFQNYRAVFTVLNAQNISRSWIEDLRRGRLLSTNCPEAWRQWVKSGTYAAVQAEPTRDHRTVDEQLPKGPLEAEIVAAIYTYFRAHPTQFEFCAARLAGMMDPNIVIDEVTRAVVDGGRDAVGRYRVGPRSDPVEMEFALEAKCYSPGVGGLKCNPVGVRETSRLISRLRHRQFGILVTTSVVGKQAYEEIRQDRHPVVVLCGRDIAQLLIAKGKNTVELVREWLVSEFPLPQEAVEGEEEDALSTQTGAHTA
jgi:hypothetical protein